MVSTVSKTAPSTTVVKKEEPKKEPPKKEEPPKTTPPKTGTTEVKTADLKAQPSGGLDPKTQFTVTRGLQGKNTPAAGIQNAGTTTTTTGDKPGTTVVKGGKEPGTVKTAELPVTGGGTAAKKTAADAGQPVTAAGQKSDGVIGKIQQVAPGVAQDCWWLAGVQGFAKDKEGKKVIQEAISTNKDGSFTVRFEGNNDKAIKVSKADISKQKLVTQGSDIDAKIITVAADKYFDKRNTSDMEGGGVAPDAMKLLTGTTPGVFTNKSGKAQVKSFLQGSADTLGKGKVVTVAGRYVDDRKVNFDTNRTNHTVTITKISGNTVTYTNTHDTSRPQTISLDKLAGQIANDKNNSYISYTYI